MQPIIVILVLGAILFYFTGGVLESELLAITAIVCTVVAIIFYFLHTDFACWANETCRSVEDCTIWYCEEAYDAAKDGDSDEYVEIMYNFVSGMIH